MRMMYFSPSFTIVIFLTFLFLLFLKAFITLNPALNKIILFVGWIYLLDILKSSSKIYIRAFAWILWIYHISNEYEANSNPVSSIKILILYQDYISILCTASLSQCPIVTV